MRADELLRRLGERLLGEAADLAGRLEIAVALGRVGGETVVGVEAEPARVVVAGTGPLEPALGRLQGAAGRLGVVGAGMRACLDETEEAHGAGRRQAAVAFQGGLGEVHALVTEAAVGGLEGHGGQDVAPEGDVRRRPGQAQGLDVVALGRFLLARVEGHPAREPGEFRGGAEEGPADLVGVGAEQQGGRLHP